MNDTIAAPATPLLSAAMGVLRVSGPDAFPMAARLFTPKRPGLSLADLPPRQMTLGRLCDDRGRLLDEAMAALFPAPHSYTGEDVAEFYCHGSPPVLQAVLESLWRLGARPAEPGEFTKRAFLNGRMDLTQAEAVADLVTARTQEAALNAAGQLEGRVKTVLDGVYDTLSGLAAHFYAVVDYPDDDVEPFALSPDPLRREAGRLSALADTFARGRILREGVSAAIIGRPNVGKSSLLNALLGFDRAIVTERPGTTRDTLDVFLQMGGVPVRLTDTAGLRADHQDPVEHLGQERARRAAMEAALLFVVLDGSEPLTDEDRAALAMIGDKPSVVVLNKSDKPPVLTPTSLTDALPSGTALCPVSALTGKGLSALDDAVAALFGGETAPACGEVLTNARQAAAVRRAADCLTAAAAAVTSGLTPDAALTDVEAAMEAVAEVTGRHVSEDILNTIFERFCVGK